MPKKLKDSLSRGDAFFDVEERGKVPMRHEKLLRKVLSRGDAETISNSKNPAVRSQGRVDLERKARTTDEHRCTRINQKTQIWVCTFAAAGLFMVSGCRERDVNNCLECGKEMKQLTVRHLSSHGMSQEENRKKYGFTMRTPLAAKSLTKARSKSAKKRGLPEKLQEYIEGRRQAKAEGAIQTAPGTDAANKPKRTRLRKKNAV